jgi:uncharacterized protein (TIGR03083 family)
MRIAEHIAELDRQGQALAAAAGRAGLDAAVPPCPGWRVRALLDHTGGVHHWAAAHVREGASCNQQDLVPAPATGVLEWYVAEHAALVTALREAPADIDSWTFLPAPSPLAFWARRQAHEAAIHRADAEAAAGTRPTYPTEFAADGIDELVTGFVARRRGRLVSDPPRTLLIAPTDSPLRWHVTIRPDGRRISKEAAPADCTVAGSASELYQLLWNRGSRERVEVDGDPAALDLWRDLAHVTWD